MAQSLDQVYTYLKSGSLDSAEWSLDQLPHSPKQLALKAYINSQRGYKQKAILYYQEALTANPSSTLKYDCHWNLALMYQQMGLFSYASEQYSIIDKLLLERASKNSDKNLDEEHYHLNMNKGLLLSLSNSYDQAIEQFQNTIHFSANPDQKHKMLNLIGFNFHESKRYKEAVMSFNKIIESSIISSFTAKAHHNRAMALKELGEDPLPDLYKALKYKTGEARFITLMDLGELTQDMTLLDSALQYYPREADPDDYKIYHLMLQLALEQGDVAAAKGYDSLYQTANEKYLSMMRESRELAQRYATANTLAQYEQQKLQKEEEAANEKRYFLIMLALAAIALIGLGFFVYMRQRRLALVRDVTDILQRPQG